MFRDHEEPDLRWQLGLIKRWIALQKAGRMGPVWCDQGRLMMPVNGYMDHRRYLSWQEFERLIDEAERSSSKRGGAWRLNPARKN